MDINDEIKQLANDIIYSEAQEQMIQKTMRFQIVQTLDLRDPEVERQFLEALKRYGIPCGH